ncbi:MAG: deoxyribonuclease IV [Planctomycetia bacterium]|nr:deoxyribonuclease IV [Planctomycetia bacterium]
MARSLLNCGTAGLEARLSRANGGSPRNPRPGWRGDHTSRPDGVLFGDEFQVGGEVLHRRRRGEVEVDAAVGPPAAPVVEKFGRRGADVRDGLHLLHAAPFHRLEADLDRDERLEAARLAVAGVDHVVVEGHVGPAQAARLAAGARLLDELRLELLALPVEVPLGAGQTLRLPGDADRPKGDRGGHAGDCGDGERGDQVQRGAHGGAPGRQNQSLEVYDRQPSRQKAEGLDAQKTGRQTICPTAEDRVRDAAPSRDRCPSIDRRGLRKGGRTGRGNRLRLPAGLHPQHQPLGCLAARLRRSPGLPHGGAGGPPAARDRPRPDRTLRDKSIAGLVTELERAEALGIPWVVAHPGAVGEQPAEVAVARAADGIAAALTATSGLAAGILIETTAGQGSCLGATFAEIGALLARIDTVPGLAPRVGVCLDTCHVFAAGYALAPRAALDATLREFDDLVGLGRLVAIHANDSKKDRGSRVDRHEAIGRGKIGREAFRLILNHPLLRGIPLFLETPKENAQGVMTPAQDRTNLALLRRLAGPARAGSRGRAGRSPRRPPPPRSGA